MRAIVIGAALLALAGCGGAEQASPQLMDGGDAGVLPVALEELENAVMTRTRALTAAQVDRTKLQACGIPKSDATPVVERVGVRGTSWTFAGGRTWLNGCGAIPDATSDPDRPFGGTWCGVSVGFIVNGALNDPRLSLCSSTEGDLTAFVWIEPRRETRWVVVSEAGRREVYEVVESLPVRISTTDRIDPAGSASFDVAEYDAGGSLVRAYTVAAQVAG